LKHTQELGKQGPKSSEKILREKQMDLGRLPKRGNNAVTVKK